MNLLKQMIMNSWVAVFVVEEVLVDVKQIFQYMSDLGLNSNCLYVLKDIIRNT